MVVSNTLMTAEEFDQFVQQPENCERFFELIAGVPVEMPPSRKRNTIAAMLTGSYITQFVVKHDLGYVSGADSGYKLGVHDTRMPDVGFISKARVPNLQGVTFDGPPDLAVEVISPSQSPRDVLDKTKAYPKAGTALVWNLYWV